MNKQVIPLTIEDAREGQAKWLEIQRLHDLMHAAERDFGRWAEGMAALYQVPGGYFLANPVNGFVPKTEEVENG